MDDVDADRPPLSVDAVLASLRARRNETPEELAAGPPAPDNTPAYSLAVFGLLLQIAIIYWFNFVHKSGVTWKDGSAVYYVLHQERIITWLGLQIREHVPYAVTKLLTHGTLVVEAAAPLLILTPVFWRWTRPLLILLLVGLHGSIAAMVNLGHLLGRDDRLRPVPHRAGALGAARRGWRRASGGRALSSTTSTAASASSSRASLARLDVYRRLRLVSNRDAAALSTHAATSIASCSTGRSWSSIRPRRRAAGRVAEACFQILRRCRSAGCGRGRCGCPAQRARERLLRRVLAQPHAHLDLAGSGRVRRAGRAARRARPPSRRRRCARGCAVRLPFAREVGIALMFVVLAAEVSVANPSIPRAFRFERRPEWMVAAVMYPHIFESWSLFSPEAPLSDETVVVDAVTRDGRHVDPYNEVGSRVSSLPVESVPVRLGHDSFWCDYTLRIPDAAPVPPGADRVDPALPRAHRAATPDQIVRFDAYVIWQDSPKPGEPPVPTNIRKTSLPPLPRERAVKFPRLEKFRRYFVGQYMTVDARSLGFGRIVLALILLFDLWHRARVITLFYSNDGLIPNHMMLWRPPTQWMFSFFFILSRPDEVAVGVRAVRPHLPGAAGRLAHAADAGPVGRSP